MSNLIEASGGRSSRQGSGGAPIFTNRFFLGLWTNRNPLRSPAGVIYENYYHLGGTDVLSDGLNVELSNSLTIIRRPGNTAGLAGVLSSANIPDVPDSFYSFHEISGTVRVFVDTPSAPYLVTSSAVIPIFTKASGAGQSYYQGVAQSLYFSDLKESVKWLDFGVGNPGNSFSTITNSVLLSNVVTITSVNNFQIGQTVVISGSTNGSGALNGTFVITHATLANFQYVLVHGNIGSASDTGFANGCWNMGIATPTTAPTLSIVQEAVAAVAWQANTIFSTMGLLVDANGNVQQLISVNATGANTTQFGTTGNGEPNWNQTPGGTTTDNTITWTNLGPIVAWTANTLYNNISVGGTLTNPACIYDPISKSCYVNANASSAQGTSGSHYPAFTGGFANVVHDPTNTGSPPGVKWFCLGSLKIPPSWAPSHAYPNVGSVSNDDSVSVIAEPVNLSGGLPNNVTVFLQASSGGTSGTGGTAPPWATTLGSQTFDNELIWQELGSATRATVTQYTAWTPNANTPFSVIKDSNSNLQVCIVGGVSSATATGSVPWATVYGQTTVDGTVTWTCVGNSLSWAVNTIWYLPAKGFSPPQSTSPYGGADIVDTNNNVQFVTESGKSGSSTPSWATSVGASTTDGGVTWILSSVYTQNFITWQTGFGYCYAFKARTAIDQYSAVSVGGLGLIPPGANPPTNLGIPTGSADGSVSTASPTVQMAVGANAGAVVNISGLGSTDPQVDTVEIYRTKDGGLTFFFLTDIPNPSPIGGVAQPWTYQDYQPDIPSATQIGLNTLVLAPQSHFNDPPPLGLVNITQFFGRIWGSVGSTVYCSEGPLVGGPSQPPGNGFTAWNPGQFWQFPSPVTKLVPTTSSLLVFTTSDIFVISGGPQITAFFPYPKLPGLGLTSFNALATRGTLVDLITSDNRFMTLDPSFGLSETGFPIGDLITSNISPSTAYVAYHTQGSNDSALFVADGSTGWYRCNPTQSPDAAISGPVWSPKANIVGGCKAIASVEVSPGRRALLIGSASANQPILVRDSSFTTFTDNGTAYSANFVMGPIVLVQPGQLAEVNFVTCEYQRRGTSPKLAVLLNEIYDSSMTITAAVQSAGNTTYTYTLSGVNSVPPQLGDGPTITGMADSGNNGTFIISALGSGNFTVPNANGVTRSTQSGSATMFEDLTNYSPGALGVPPQDPPLVYGASFIPSSTYAPRYYLEQSINGVVPPQGVSCRYMLVRIDYGTDTVKNEALTMTIYGQHWSEL